MKKTLAILLSCVLIVAAFFAVTMLTSAATATSVDVVLSDGTTETLNASKTSIPAGEGTIAFNAGTLTLTNATGVQQINPKGGDIVIDVVGNNTIEHPDSGTSGYALFFHEGSATIRSSSNGTLNVTGKAYVLIADAGDVTVEGNVTLNLTTTGGTALHSKYKTGVVTFKDDAKIKVISNGAAVDVKGITPKLVITDNVELTIDATGTGINIQNTIAVDSTITKTSSTAIISGNAKVNILNAVQALQAIASQAKDHTSSITISDNVSFEAKATAQGIISNADYDSSDKAILQITDNVNINIDIEATTDVGKYGSGIDVRAGVNGSDVDITTIGTITIDTNSTGWVGGAVVFRAARGTHDVYIKDTVFDLTNTSCEYDKVVNVFNANSKANIVVDGNAVINAKAIHNSTTKVNRAHGIYLSANSTMSVKDNVNLTVDVFGTSDPDSWEYAAAGVYLNNSTLNMSGDSSLNVRANAKKTPAFVHQTGTLNISERAFVSLESVQSAAFISTAADALKVAGNAVIFAKGTYVANYDSSDTVNAYCSAADYDKATEAVFTATEASTYFKQAQVTLKDDLTLKFFVKYDGENPRMRFTLHDKAEIVEGVKEGDNWTFKFEGIAPQCIGDSILAELLPAAGDDTVISTRGYSILRYLNTAKTNSATSAQQKTLIDALMLYGGAAQTYTGHAGANVANGIVGSDFTELDASKKVTAVNNKDKNNFAFTAATVFFDGKNSLAFKFVNNSGKEVTFEVTGAGAGKAENGIYTTAGILASQFADTVTVTAKIDGETVGTVTYSVNSYVYAMQNKGGNIQELVRATYNYGVSAAACAQ